jgi:Kef-type K+ transport system membrane component KefB
MESVAALPPSRETLVRRWALVVLPSALVLLVIFGALDVPENYNCGDSKPDGQEERLRSFREIAFPLLGFLAIWVTGFTARWAVERERRSRFPGRRTAIVLAVLVLAGLVPWALDAMEVRLHGEEFALSIVGSLVTSAVAAWVAAALAIVATGSVIPRELSEKERERSDTVLLLFAVALLIAMPFLATAIAYQGSGWVIGC